VVAFVVAFVVVVVVVLSWSFFSVPPTSYFVLRNSYFLLIAPDLLPHGILVSGGSGEAPLSKGFTMRLTTLALLIAALPAFARPQDPPKQDPAEIEFQKKVDAAIDKGVQFLLAKYKTGGISEQKQNLYKNLADLSEKGQDTIIVVENGQPKTVVVPFDEYKNLSWEPYSDAKRY